MIVLEENDYKKKRRIWRKLI